MEKSTVDILAKLTELAKRLNEESFTYTHLCDVATLNDDIEGANVNFGKACGFQVSANLVLSLIEEFMLF